MKSYEQAEDNLFYGDWKNKYNRKIKDGIGESLLQHY